MSFHYYLKKILSREDLKRIADTIADAEKSSDGYIRVVVRHHRHLSELKMTSHEIAVKEFNKLGMQHTKHRTGVLILLLFSKKKFEIIGDTGIHEKIADGTWEKIAGGMGAHFQKGNFAEGLCAAVNEVGKVLAEHFPRTGDAADELSKDVVEE